MVQGLDEAYGVGETGLKVLGLEARGFRAEPMKPELAGMTVAVLSQASGRWACHRGRLGLACKQQHLVRTTEQPHC